MNLEARCRQVKLLLSDVDGVLTDGAIVYDNHGIETKRFHIRDGLGIKLWRQAGMHFGIITARSSHIVRVRAAELGITTVRQGYEEKWTAAQDIFRELHFRPDETAYIGDDLPDLAVLTRIGVPIAVADAADEVRAAAAHVTRAAGGHGAVREAVEWLLRSQGLWDDLVARCTGA